MTFSFLYQAEHLAGAFLVVAQPSDAESLRHESRSRGSECSIERSITRGSDASEFQERPTGHFWRLIQAKKCEQCWSDVS